MVVKALVHGGPDGPALLDRPTPEIQQPDDAILRVSRTTICGTDLHLLKGDAPTCTPGRILGHEGAGVIEWVGAGVTQFRAGDHVLVFPISCCGRCAPCRRGMYSHCETGGWILGNTVDGTQADHVRTPHADTSLHRFPPCSDEDALVMLGDILPTGFECGVLNGTTEPGSSIAIVGAGSVGLAALLTAQSCSPPTIIMIDLDDNRFRIGRQFGATRTINSADGSTADAVRALTEGRGVDTVIEAGGIIANVGVNGTKAGNDEHSEPDVVLACADDVPTLEMLAAVDLLRQHLPQVKVRVVNVADLMTLQPKMVHPHGLTDADLDAIFTTNKPVIFAFHGYPTLIHRLVYKRTNHRNFHVRGIIEEGSTTTPFDMVVRNLLDRFHLVCDVINTVPSLGSAAVHAKQRLPDKLTEHELYVRSHGQDMPEVLDWAWTPGM